MIYQTIVVAAAMASGVAALGNASPESVKLMFESFKSKHGRKYATMEEEMSRFETFKQTLHNIDARNEAERTSGGSAVHGINRFADWTEAEFKGLLNYEKANVTSTVAEVPKYTGSSTSADWTGTYTTPVKDQGYCGSCWAFAASEQIESDAMRILGVTEVLSPQQLVECDKTSLGCNGGLQERAYNYVKRAGGIELESDYPYTSGADGSAEDCSADSSKFVLTVTDYSTIKGESSMADYVLSTGPVSIAIDASTWSSYTGGIMTSCGNQINHAVQAVGVDTGSGGYWKVRNSWSEDWGEDGFIRLAYGEDMCGITYDVTYVSPAKV